MPPEFIAALDFVGMEPLQVVGQSDSRKAVSRGVIVRVNPRNWTAPQSKHEQQAQEPTAPADRLYNSQAI